MSGMALIQRRRSLRRRRPEGGGGQSGEDPHIPPNRSTLERRGFLLSDTNMDTTLTERYSKIATGAKHLAMFPRIVALNPMSGRSGKLMPRAGVEDMAEGIAEAAAADGRC